MLNLACPITVIDSTMLKKISKKLRKNQNHYYSPLINYDLSDYSYKMVTYDVKKNPKKELILNRNQVKNLSDDFYSQLYSFKNLPKHYFFLITVVAPIISAMSIYLSFVASRQGSDALYSSILGTISFIIFIICRDKNKKSILQKQSLVHNKSFATIDEVILYWIRDRIGSKTDIYEFAKNLSEWKSLKDKYNRNAKINWFNYIYDPQSKPRILALFIALVSLFTVVTLNTFKVEPLSVLFVFFVLKHFLMEQTGLVLFLIIIMVFLFWQIIFVSHMLSKFIIYLIDYLNKDNLSELKFSILMDFLLDHTKFYD